jgi:hypothetical protein
MTGTAKTSDKDEAKPALPRSAAAAATGADYEMVHIESLRAQAEAPKVASIAKLGLIFFWFCLCLLRLWGLNFQEERHLKTLLLDSPFVPVRFWRPYPKPIFVIFSAIFLIFAMWSALKVILERPQFPEMELARYSREARLFITVQALQKSLMTSWHKFRRGKAKLGFRRIEWTCVSLSLVHIILLLETPLTELQECGEDID